MKDSISKFLSLFGIGIYLIRKDKKDQPKKKTSWKDFKIESPVQHNTPERMDQFFSDEAMLEQYLDESRIAFYEELVDMLNERGINARNKKILDCGCGTGHLLKIFSGDAGCNISGSDFSKEALKVAMKTIPSGNFFSHDIYNALRSRYDIIFCTEVLEHLLDPEIALRNLVNALNENSVLILTVPNGRMDFYEGHINFWSPESWKKFLSQNLPDLKTETGLLSENKNNFAIIKK